MSIKVWLTGKRLFYPNIGGWAFLNWALGLQALGCEVTWLELVDPSMHTDEVRARVDTLKSRLERYNLSESIALCSKTDEPLPRGMAEASINIEASAEADLLLNLVYAVPSQMVKRFRRSALVDIDPGLLQTWMSRGLMSVARHDVYFTIGETVGHRGARFPDCGLEWHYTPPCVALEWWPPRHLSANAYFTTVSQWWQNEWVDGYRNDKRNGSLPFLDLPRLTHQPFEMALFMGGNGERTMLEQLGWSIRDTLEVASTPWDYQRYIQDSLGEFSCAKPSCISLQNAWISDRTLCYMASGKPTIVQHTGPSRFLPDAAGMFRFRDLDEAVKYIEFVSENYDQECKNARALAEEYFDSRKVLRRVLELALG